MASDNSDYSDVISRRRFVEITGVAGAAALAGCGGDGGDDTTEPEDDDGAGDGDGDGDTTEPEDGDGDGDGGGDFPDERHVGATTINPNDVQFNATNTSNEAQIAHHVLFEKFAQYYFNDSEFKSAGVEEWEFTGDEFVMTLRDDLMWNDGNEVTADDVVTQLRIAKHDEDAMFDWAESVEATGDYEVTVSVGEDVNPALVETDVLQRFIRQSEAEYGDFAEGLESGDTEISEVREYVGDEPVTNGPFEISDRDEQILLTERMDDSPYAEDINFGEYAFRSLGDNQARRQALLNLNVDSDFSLTVQAPTVANFPDAVEEVQIPNIFGIGLAPNHNHPHLGQRAVRQAIQYVINRQAAVDFSYPRVKVAPDVPTAIPSAVQDDWLGDQKSDFESYGKEESLTDEAASVLEDAGFSESGDGWEDGDGNPVAFTVTTPGGWGDWSLALESAVNDLNDFGFNVTIEETGSYFEILSQPDNWDCLTNTWLHGSPPPYPYYSLLHQLNAPQEHACHNNYPGYREQFGGSNADVEVPGMDGGTMTVNPADELETLSQTTDEDEAQSIVRELAWVANQDLPRIPILEKNLQAWLTDDDWAIPDDVGEDDDARVRYAPTWLPRQGKMNYRG